MVYVDDANILYKGKPRFHMSADSIEELHAAAAAAGINRCWFHSGARWPHYDVTGPQREVVLAQGARAVSDRELVGILKSVFGSRPAVARKRKAA